MQVLLPPINDVRTWCAYVRKYVRTYVPYLCYVRACVCSQVQHTMMQTALDAVGITPPPALEPTSPSTMNDVPPPLPPGHHGNDAPDSGGSVGKVRKRKMYKCWL